MAQSFIADFERTVHAAFFSAASKLGVDRTTLPACISSSVRGNFGTIVITPPEL